MTRYHPCPERTAWRHETVRGGWYTLQRLWRLRRWHWLDRVAVILTVPIRVLRFVSDPPTVEEIARAVLLQQASAAHPFRHEKLSDMVNVANSRDQLRLQAGHGAAQSKSADEFLADGGKPGVFSSRPTDGE